MKILLIALAGEANKMIRSIESRYPLTFAGQFIKVESIADAIPEIDLHHPDLLVIHSLEADLSSMLILPQITPEYYYDKLQIVSNNNEELKCCCRQNSIPYMTKDETFSKLASYVYNIYQHKVEQENERQQVKNKADALLNFPPVEYEYVTDKGVEIIRLDQISYIESDGKCSCSWFNGSKQQTFGKMLGFFEVELLDHLYFRIHNERLVNMNLIKEYSIKLKKRLGSIKMMDDTILHISKGRLEGTYLKFDQHIKEKHVREL